jgi:hypothetical protein
MDYSLMFRSLISNSAITSSKGFSVVLASSRNLKTESTMNFLKIGEMALRIISIIFIIKELLLKE